MNKRAMIQGVFRGHAWLFRGEVVRGIMDATRLGECDAERMVDEAVDHGVIRESKLFIGVRVYTLPSNKAKVV